MNAILKGELTESEIVVFIGLRVQTVQRALRTLESKKQIVRAGQLYIPVDRLADPGVSRNSAA